MSAITAMTDTRWRRAIGLETLLLALTLAVVGPVRAADPPADVVLDGTVTVTFAVEGDPVADAAIVLEAGRTGDAEPFQVLDGTTDATGVAVLTGVARPMDGAPPVQLHITGHKSEPNECGSERVYEGMADVESALTVEVTLRLSVTSSCVAVPLTGTVVGPDGEPFAVEVAAAEIGYPDGTEDKAVEIAADGTFTIVVGGWPGEAPVEVRLVVTGALVVETDPDTGCETTSRLVAEHAWTLVAPPASNVVVPVTVEATEEVLGTVCETTGTPAPEAPAPTLPPTDVTVAGAVGSGTLDVSGLVPVALVVAFAGLAASVVLGWATRRGS